MPFARQLVGTLTVASVTLAGPLTAQDPDFSNVEITAVHVAGFVYMLQGQGGNIGLVVGEDGPFVIDDQFAPLSEKIQRAITAITPMPVKFIMNTHWHGDHTGGNENFGQAGALIVAHQNVRKRMNPAEFQDLMGNSNQAPPDALPVVTFTDQVNFFWNGGRIHVIHVASAHTDGDAIVHLMHDNVLHMGDTFFNGRYPFIDTNSGGDVDGMIEAANLGLELSNSATKIIPGHGDLGTPEDLRAYRDMLVTVRDRIRIMKNDGKTEDEVVTAHPTADLDAEWGANAERFVRAVYQTS